MQGFELKTPCCQSLELSAEPFHGQYPASLTRNFLFLFFGRGGSCSSQKRVPFYISPQNTIFRPFEIFVKICLLTLSCFRAPAWKGCVIVYFWMKHDLANLLFHQTLKIITFFFGQHLINFCLTHPGCLVIR